MTTCAPLYCFKEFICFLGLKINLELQQTRNGLTTLLFFFFFLGLFWGVGFKLETTMAYALFLTPTENLLGQKVIQLPV